MKKEKETTKRFFSWVAVISIFWIIIAFAPQEPKKYKVELTLEETNNLIYSLENSSAPHNIVTGLIKNIADQVNKQLAVEKQITDSLNKKKNQ